MTAQTVTQAVEKREASPVGIMWSRRSHFRAVLPASVDVEAFLGTAAGALYASKTLMEYAQANPDSLIVAMMRCAALGHLPGTDEYYLTPRKVKGRPSVLGIEGYRGVIERMYRSGAVAKVVVREVCARDKFRYVDGVDDKPVHSFGGDGETGASFFGANGARDRGAMVGVYAYAELLTGAISRVVLLTRDDVHAARDSGGWKPDDEYSPWNRLDAGKAHPEFQGRSMWWKTGAKRLEPWVPTSAEYRRERLRAASAAADQAAMRERVPDLPAVNGQPEPQDIHDAEVIPEPPRDHRPAPKGQPAPPAAVKKMEDLIAQLQLGPPPDVDELIRWRCPGYSATVAQVRDFTGYLRDHLEQALKACGGDMDEALEAAARAIWHQYREALARDAGEPAGDGDG